MKKRKTVVILIAAIIVLNLAGCRAEKDNVSSMEANNESGTTETISGAAEPPASKVDNKPAEVTQKTESNAPTESNDETKPKGNIPEKESEPKKPEKPKVPPEAETDKTESEKPTAPTESVSKSEEIQKPTESSEPEKQEPEFNIDYYIKSAQEYAVKSGLKLDRQAKYCWDNPIAAGETCRYTERDIKGYIYRYARSPEITAVWIWAEENGKDYEIYIGYA